MTIIVKNLHFFLLLIISIFFILTNSHSCSLRTEKSSCSPFNSTISYPFSTTPGCGNPWFQVHCLNQSLSVLSINNLSFSLLHFEPNTSSLLVSPLSLLNPTTTTTTSTKTQCSSVLTHSINLSGSPFRFSDSSCSRLSFVKPCKPSLTSLPNCSVCSWECELYKQPIKLLQGCESKNHSDNQEEDEEHNGCQEDFFGFLEIYLRNGIQIQYDENIDSWFSKCTICESRNGFCGFNSSDPLKPFHCSSQNTHQVIIHKHKPKKIALFISLFIFVCVLFLGALILAIFRFRRSYPSQTEEDPTTLFLHKHRSPNLLLPPVYSYEELESATNGFDPKRKIGDGGFGSVFLGQLFDTRLVAVKKLHKLHSTTAASKPFCNEILILSSINHPNLVKLHGYCIDPRGLLLVYDYVPNGTLADHLHGCKSLYKKGSLSWQVRVEVALQTAMAVEYLHFSVDPAIVHRDITSSNIFVEKDMKIKVGDFGLSRLLVYPESSISSRYIWTGPQGTPGYLDPDYHRSFRLTEKSDVYSLGVILLELISGMKAVDLNRDKREIALVDLVVSKIQVGCLHQVIDPLLVSSIEGEEGIITSVESMAELAFRCVAAEKDDRPDAKEVVAQLKHIKSCICTSSRHR